MNSMSQITNTNKDVASTDKIKKLAVAEAFPFNPFDPEFHTDPYPTYNCLRSCEPIHRFKSFTGGNEWLLTRFADVKAVLNDSRFVVDDLPKRLKDKSFYLKQEGDFNTLTQTISKWLFFLDPPEHTRLRGVLSKAFAANTLESMRPQIQKIVDGLLGKVQEAGSMDVIADLACPLPAIVTASILGVPTEQHSELTQWAHDLFYVFDQPISLKDYEYLNKVALEFREYFSSLIAEREKKPLEDLLSYLIAAKSQGGKLSEDEILASCAMLFSVGQQTTENLIGNGVLALLHHPQQMQKLKAQPTIISSAIEELLRYDSPVQLISRLAIEDVEIGGETIRAGERIVVCLGAANRDPAQFPDPDRLSLTRQHYSLPFGSGIHYCLGAMQARILGQIAINTIVQRWDLKLNTNKLEWRKNASLRGLKALPVTFNA
ncbi:MAG: cytochrome P450 [Rhizonema sp. PD38]|nr:cytochrome P450 [Rhizonema sp. PD38]